MPSLPPGEEEGRARLIISQNAQARQYAYMMSGQPLAGRGLLSGGLSLANDLTNSLTSGSSSPQGVVDPLTGLTKGLTDGMGLGGGLSLGADGLAIGAKTPTAPSVQEEEVDCEEEVEDDQPFSLLPRDEAEVGNGLMKRIMMNPPQSFIDMSAIQNPPVRQVNAPIVFGQGGQAVMVPELPAEEATGNVGPVAPVIETTPTAASIIASVAPSAAPTVAITSASAITQTTEASTTPTQTTAQTPSTTPQPTTESATSTTETPTSTQPSTLASTSTESSQSSATSSMAISSSSSATAASASASISASPSASAVAAAAHKPFTQSAPFIIILVLGSLVVVAILATSLSWIFRYCGCGCAPCGRRKSQIDDDGLSEFVQSLHSQPPSRSSTLLRSSNGALIDEFDPEMAMNKRSTMLATNPSQSPFLHAGSNWDGQGYPHQSMMMPSGTAAPSINMPAPAHLFGVTGPLEVRNAMPGEMSDSMTGSFNLEGDLIDHGTPKNVAHSVGTSSPRYLGLDGNGLEVPWSRQSSRSIGLGVGSLSHRSSLTAPFPAQHDSRDYLGSPFPSPSASEEQLNRVQREIDSETVLDSPPPQRAGTWASNLRSTLFAAIQGVRSTGMEEDSDRFTRPVLPLHRNSTRRKAEEGFDGFPIIEEKSGHLGSVNLAPSYSSASSLSSSGMTTPRRKVPLRGASAAAGLNAGERYKRYYAKSRDSPNPLDEEDESGAESNTTGWTVGRMPSRLAGGDRARGVVSRV